MAKSRGKKPVRRTRPGEWAIIFAEVPPVVKAVLEERAAANRRSLTAELTVLLEREFAQEILAKNTIPKNV
jgi:hypothetical protein